MSHTRAMSTQGQAELFAELQVLKEQNQSLLTDLTTLNSKIAGLKDEVAKQKRKRLMAQKESKELKEENRRLNVLVASLQGHAAPNEDTLPSPTSSKSKRSAPTLPNTSSSPSMSPSSSSSNLNGSSSNSASTAAPMSKRWALTEDSISAISASLAHHQSMPSLPGSVKLPPTLARPPPPSGAPPTSTSSIMMGSPPINYLNPGVTTLPPALRGAGMGESAGSPPISRGDSGLLASSSNGSLRIGLVHSNSGSSLNTSGGIDTSTGNIFGPPSDVLYAADHSIRAAPLDTLIRLLPSSDSGYIDTFLMTYRAFCGAEELFQRMVSLWDLASSSSTNPDALKVFRIKFMNVMIKWIEKHGVDFDDASLMKVSKFLDVQSAEGNVATITKDKISKLIRHKLERTSKKVLHNADLQTPTPILPPPELDELDVTVIDPLELARQITLLDEQAFKSIAPSECMNKAWSGDACAEASPNIIKMISRFNATSNWTARLIVSEPNIRKRKSIITRIIKIANRLRELHNYHSLMAFVAALESAPVTRLKKTWDTIDSAYIKQFQELRSIMSADYSYRDYRAVLKSDDPPVIPYIGVYLGDLTFIEDGNPSTIQHETMGQLINFAKMKLLDSVIQDITMYQLAPYKLEPVPKIQILLAAQEDIKSTDKELFELSLKSEPRVAPK